MRTDNDSTLSCLYLEEEDERPFPLKDPLSLSSNMPV